MNCNKNSQSKELPPPSYDESVPELGNTVTESESTRQAERQHLLGSTPAPSYNHPSTFTLKAQRHPTDGYYFPQTPPPWYPNAAEYTRLTKRINATLEVRQKNLSNSAIPVAIGCPLLLILFISFFMGAIDGVANDMTKFDPAPYFAFGGLIIVGMIVGSILVYLGMEDDGWMELVEQLNGVGWSLSRCEHEGCVEYVLVIHRVAEAV